MLIPTFKSLSPINCGTVRVSDKKCWILSKSLPRYTEFPTPGGQAGSELISLSENSKG